MSYVQTTHKRYTRELDHRKGGFIVSGRKRIRSVCGKVLDFLPYVGRLRKQLRSIWFAEGCYPAGHYYSPIPHREDVQRYLVCREKSCPELPGIDLNETEQMATLQDYAKYYNELPFRETKQPGFRYCFSNDMFKHGDGIYLYGFLRRNKPRRIIEVGSGFSSGLILDTVDQFFEHRPEMTFIDPYPERLYGVFTPQDSATVRVLAKKAQDVSLDTYLSLKAGDLLFIDSSHVVKVGSDVQFLLFEVLPRLPSGVFVHFHDICYPFEYHSHWLRDGWYWNEAYFLRSFLTYNQAWKIHFFSGFVAAKFHDYINQHMPLCLEDPGVSLYIQRVSSA